LDVKFTAIKKRSIIVGRHKTSISLEDSPTEKQVAPITGMIGALALHRSAWGMGVMGG